MLSEIPKSQKIMVMIGVMLAMLLSALDQTIVATAMPRIVQELNGLQQLSWVFTAYMLASTVTVPIYGKLSDMYGRKNYLLFGIVVFLTGSILCGFSQNITQLIIFRAIQGLGGGALMANAFAIIGDLFPPAERGKWQGMMGAIFGLASVLGPSLGGYLTDVASWRWNFFINIPVGILAFAAIAYLMPKIIPDKKDSSIDITGAILLTISLMSLLLGLEWGINEFGWDSWQNLSLLGSAALFTALFILYERTAKDPILPLDLFKNSIFTVSMISLFLVGLGMFGAILYIPLFAQSVLGVSATDSGTILTPLMLGLIISSIITGQLISRTGKYKWAAVGGLGIVSIAMYWLSTMNVDTTRTELMLRTILTGIGMGMTMPVFTLAVQNAFDHSRLGVVTASTQLFRSIGGTVGVAIMGMMLNNSLAQGLGDLSQDRFLQTIARSNPNFNTSTLDSNMIQGMISQQGQARMQTLFSQLPDSLQPQIMQSFTEFMHKVQIVMSDAIDQVFFVGMIMMLIAFVVVWFLKEIPLRKTHKRGKLEEAGVEVGLEEGEFPAASEPSIL